MTQMTKVVEKDTETDIINVYNEHPYAQEGRRKHEQEDEENGRQKDPNQTLEMKNKLDGINNR